MADQDLALRLERHHQRVADAVQRFRTIDDHPDDAFRGLYLSDDHVDMIVAGGRSPVGQWGKVGLPGANTPMGGLARRFGLTELDVEILVVAVAPDLDRRYEQLYGYLQDDVSRRRASPGLVIDLLGLSAVDVGLRHRFERSGPLAAARLIEIDEADRPFLTRQLRVPDRVAAHLLGGVQPTSELRTALLPTEPSDDEEGTEELARLLSYDGCTLYLRESIDGEARSVGAAAAARTDRAPLVVDLWRSGLDEQRDIAEIAVREAQLLDAVLVVGPVDGVDRGVVALLAESRARVVLFGRDVWDPGLVRTTVVPIELGRPDRARQLERWQRATDQHPLQSSDVFGNGEGSLVESFRLGPAQIARAVEAASLLAVMRGRPLDVRTLAEGAKSQNSAGLDRLARRVTPNAEWDDLVLPARTESQLRHLIVRVAKSRVVLDGWGFRRGGGRGEGISALFVGASGTGKTLAAEVVAGALGLDLYVIDLSSVVDKYIGETEKNLDRVFDEAEGVNGVLFFDEADALFGKRSEISDAKDRYANVEVAYLLQRMEQFDGLAILASNLRGNLDEAFARRLSLIVDFPDPDEAQRWRLWDVLLGEAPRSDDIDYGFLASAFEVSGGNIRNISLTAAYLAADAGHEVTMLDIVRGVEHEYRKLGRLCDESEFGPYYHELGGLADR